MIVSKALTAVIMDPVGILGMCLIIITVLLWVL